MSEHRLVTLVGVGGVGKTRLSLQVGAEVLPRFEQGVWLVELAPVLASSDVASAVAGVFGLEERRGLSLAESLVAAFGQRRMLIVLDNCEHVLDGVRPLVGLLLSRCAGMRFLATSREALAIQGEFAWPVASLPVADSARLFVDRARAAGGTTSVEAGESAAVEGICRRLDGLPLAIELAATRTKHLSPTEIAERLDARFRLLRGGRNAIERHQTLRATIDWSFGLLDADEQHVLCALSVFAGGFDIAGAEAVVAGERIDAFDVLDLVSSLVDKSLVIAERAGSATRYRLLETIRQYAEERLVTTGDAIAIRDRHAAHYAQLVRDVASGLVGPDYLAWAARLSADLGNVRAAHAWGLDRDDGPFPPITAAELGPSHLVYTPFLPVFGDLARRGVEHARACGREPDPALLAVTAYGLLHAGRVDEAQQHLTTALRSATGRARVWALYVSSAMAMVRRDLVEAEEITLRAIDDARRLEPGIELANLLFSLCSIHSPLQEAPVEEWAQARWAADELESLADRTRNPKIACYAASGVAMSYIDIDRSRAHEAVRRSIELAQTTGLLWQETLMATMTLFIDDTPDDALVLSALRAGFDQALEIDDHQMVGSLQWSLVLYLMITGHDEWAARVMRVPVETIAEHRRENALPKIRADFARTIWTDVSNPDRFDAIVSAMSAALEALDEGRAR